MDTCKMYSLFSLSGTLKVWQINYCTAQYTECARYKRSCEAKLVPDNLLPNGSLLKLADK